MTNTNTNTKQWKKEQYEVYASSFVNGDAILANGKWCEVWEFEDTVYGKNVIQKDTLCLPLPINVVHNNEAEGSCAVFDSEYTDAPCEIATLDEYMPQDNDRVIWLGQHILQFYTGKEDVVVESGEISEVKEGKISVWVVYEEKFVEVDIDKLPEKQLWGYIPRWDNIKGFNNTLLVEDVVAIDEAEESSVVNKAVEVLSDWYGKETTYQRLIEDLVNMVSMTALDGDYKLSQTALNLVQQLEEELK